MPREYVRVPETERFWSKVDKHGPPYFGLGPCWLWTGALTGSGYGLFMQTPDGTNGRFTGIGAHRYAYRLLGGELLDGFQLDHLCRNPRCVNPAHLEQVPPRTNTRRGIGPSAVNAVKTHCIHGHEFTPENTYTVPGKGTRTCRTCKLRIANETNSRVPKQNATTCAACGRVVGVRKSGRLYPHNCEGAA